MLFTPQSPVLSSTPLQMRAAIESAYEIKLEIPGVTLPAASGLRWAVRILLLSDPAASRKLLSPVGWQLQFFRCYLSTPLQTHSRRSCSSCTCRIAPQVSSFQSKCVLLCSLFRQGSMNPRAAIFSSPVFLKCMCRTLLFTELSRELLSRRRRVIFGKLCAARLHS